MCVCVCVCVVCTRQACAYPHTARMPQDHTCTPPHHHTNRTSFSELLNCSTLGLPPTHQLCDDIMTLQVYLYHHSNTYTQFSPSHTHTHTHTHTSHWHLTLVPSSHHHQFPIITPSPIILPSPPLPTSLTHILTHIYKVRKGLTHDISQSVWTYTAFT